MKASSLFLRPLSSRKVSSQEQENELIETGISSIDVWGKKGFVMCLFCGKLLRYKSFILTVDERIMALKIRVADLW